jgi:hypothetical protein
LAELENFKVWSGRPEPAVDFHTARGLERALGDVVVELAAVGGGLLERRDDAVELGELLHVRAAADGDLLEEVLRVDEEDVEELRLQVQLVPGRG